MPNYAQLIYPDLLREPQYLQLSNAHGFLPLGGQPNTDTALCDEGYGFKAYRSDRFGFRNEDKLWDAHISALLIGDSMVQGVCVDNDAHLSSLLTKRHGMNSVNVAMASNSPNQYRALTETFVPLTKPDHVVLFFYPNDQASIAIDDIFLTTSGERLQAEYHASGISDAGVRFYEAAQSVANASSQIPNPPAAAANLCAPGDLERAQAPIRARIVENSARSGALADAERLRAFVGAPVKTSILIATLEPLRRALGPAVKQSLRKAPIPPASAAAIDAVMQRCRDACKPLFVLLPNSNYWRADATANSYFAAIESYIRTKYAERAPALLDARAFIDGNDLENFSPEGPHYSTAAFERLAAAVARTLKSDDSR